LYVLSNVKHNLEGDKHDLEGYDSLSYEDVVMAKKHHCLLPTVGNVYVHRFITFLVNCSTFPNFCI